MSSLSAFLHPVVEREEKEIVISNRFVGEDKKPVAFKVRSLTQEETDAITKQSQKTRKVNGQPQEYLDSVDFARRMVVAATMEPDFTSRELCDRYGVMDPLLVPGKMLLTGEFSRLLQAITALSGFESAAELEEQAKN